MKKIIVKGMVGAFMTTSGLFMAFDNALARENILSGAISVGQGYRSNVLYTESDPTSEWETTVIPKVTITSTSPEDTLSIQLTPAHTYNYRRDEIDSVQAISVLADKKISSRWQLFLSDNFSYSDKFVYEADPSLSLLQRFLRVDETSQAEIIRLLFPGLVWTPEQKFLVLSLFRQRFDLASTDVQNQVITLLQPTLLDDARKRFWTNNIAVSSQYQFARDGIFTASYGFAEFSDRTGNQSDSGIHTPSLSLTYRLNQKWLAELGLGYTDRNYDSTEDNSTDNAHLRFDYQADPEHLYFTSYNYENTKFDNNSSDQTDHLLQIGMQRALDSNTELFGTLDTSYLSRDTAYNEREAVLALNLSRGYQRATAAISGNAKIREEDSSGSWDRLQRSWLLSSNVTYELQQNLDTQAYATYEQIFSWAGSQKITYDELTAGASISRSFMKYFILTFRYDYHLYSTDNNELNDYTDHRLVLELSASKVLWRW